jgi:hypothetical protein
MGDCPDPPPPRGGASAVVCSRFRLPQKFPNEDEVFDAVKHFQSWRRITHEALAPKRKTKTKRVTGAALALRRWRKELKQMDFTKDDFRALEDFRADIDRILAEQKKERTTA